VLIDKFAQKTALRLGVSVEAVRAEFKKISRAKPAPAEPTEEIPQAEVEMERPSTVEFWMLKLIFLNEDRVEWCAANLQPDWIQHALVRPIYVKRIDAHRAGTWHSLGAFLNGCESAEMRNLVTAAAAGDRPLPKPEQQLLDVATRLRNQFIERQLAALMHRANQPELNDEQRVDLLKQQQEIRELKRKALPAPM